MCHSKEIHLTLLMGFVPTLKENGALALLVVWKLEESRSSRGHSEFQMKLYRAVVDAGFYRLLRTQVSAIINLIRILCFC